MQMREVGQSGLTTAPLVLGGNVFGWTADRAALFDILDAFIDAGFRQTSIRAGCRAISGASPGP